MLVPLNLNSLHSCGVAREYGSPRSVRCFWLSAYKMFEPVPLSPLTNLCSSVPVGRILRVFLLLPRPYASVRGMSVVWSVCESVGDDFFPEIWSVASDRVGSGWSRLIGGPLFGGLGSVSTSTCGGDCASRWRSSMFGGRPRRT